MPFSLLHTYLFHMFSDSWGQDLFFTARMSLTVYLSVVADEGGGFDRDLACIKAVGKHGSRTFSYSFMATIQGLLWLTYLSSFFWVDQRLNGYDYDENKWSAIFVTPSVLACDFLAIRICMYVTLADDHDDLGILSSFVLMLVSRIGCICISLASEWFFCVPFAVFLIGTYGAALGSFTQYSDPSGTVVAMFTDKHSVHEATVSKERQVAWVNSQLKTNGGRERSLRCVLSVYRSFSDWRKRLDHVLVAEEEKVVKKGYEIMSLSPVTDQKEYSDCQSELRAAECKRTYLSLRRYVVTYGPLFAVMICATVFVLVHHYWVHHGDTTQTYDLIGFGKTSSSAIWWEVIIGIGIFWAFCHFLGAFLKMQRHNEAVHDLRVYKITPKLDAHLQKSAASLTGKQKKNHLASMKWEREHFPFPSFLGDAGYLPSSGCEFAIGASWNNDSWDGDFESLKQVATNVIIDAYSLGLSDEETLVAVSYAVTETVSRLVKQVAEYEIAKTVADYYCLAKCFDVHLASFAPWKCEQDDASRIATPNTRQGVSRVLLDCAHCMPSLLLVTITLP